MPSRSRDQVPTRAFQNEKDWHRSKGALGKSSLRFGNTLRETTVLECPGEGLAMSSKRLGALANRRPGLLYETLGSPAWA